MRRFAVGVLCGVVLMGDGGGGGGWGGGATVLRSVARATGASGPAGRWPDPGEMARAAAFGASAFLHLPRDLERAWR